jgi:tRNA pseudouridine55 synthase
LIVAKGRSANNTPAVNGFINLYKPVGITSMEALRRIKRITGQRQKVGHGGTMDPLARGVLPVCFGQATRLMEYVVGGLKRYVMDVTLGVSTTTYDAEGEVSATRSPDGVTLADIETALEGFVGAIMQTPPMYSAVKVDGQRLYKLARAGIEVEREPREVEVHSIQVVEFAPPRLKLDVECGRGVYMRSLAHDLGELLGCGGHVADLVRMRCSGFNADDGVTLDQLTADAASDEGWRQHLHPIDWVLRDLKSITVGGHAEQFLRHGQPVSLGRPALDAGYLEQFRAYDAAGRFLALVRYNRPENSWRPVKVFQLDTPSPLASVPTP